jgi:hypothetical protein
MAGSRRIMGHIMMSFTLADLQSTELLRMGLGLKIAYHYLLSKHQNQQKQTYKFHSVRPNSCSYHTLRL